MAAQNLVLLTKTDGKGSQFKVSTTKIIKFKGINSGADSTLTYIDQRGKVVTQDVDQTPAQIDALTGGRTQAVTLYDGGATVYINSDNIVYLDTTAFGCRITYNISGVAGKYRQPPEFIDVTETPASINTAAGNTGKLVMTDGSSRWVNGDYIDIVTHAADGTPNYEVLYDDKKTEFRKLFVNSSGSDLSIGSGWA